MYRIYADEYLLHDEKYQDTKILNPKLSLEVNTVGSFSFKILPNHDRYDAITNMNTIITVYKDSSIVFKGRVYSVSKDFRNIKTIECEGLLAYLNDSIVRNYNYTGSVVDYVTYLIESHNNQVNDEQKFKIGNITVTDSNDYIVRAQSSYPTTWKEIQEKCVDLLGGYICIRYTSDGNYVDYIADYDDVSTQQIAFAVNLLDITSDVDASSLVTAIIPYGAEIDDESVETTSEEETSEEEIEETSKKRVDITSVNDGVDYIFDANAAALYGMIYEVVTWDDVTNPSNLLAKAQLYLSNKVHLTDKLTVNAIDLNLSDSTIESFKLGDKVQIYSKPHNINQTALLTGYELDISSPADCIITIGLERSSYLADAYKANNNQTNNLIKQIDDSVTTLTDRVLSESQTYTNTQIEDSQKKLSSLFAEYMISTESTETTETWESTIEQVANAIKMTFESSAETITNVNGELQKEITTRKSIIDFTDDDAGGVVTLGKDNYEYKTRLSNGKLAFIYNDNVDVAYFEKEKLNVTSVEATNDLTIGNFAFIPRKNGNLTFKKVKGD